MALSRRQHWDTQAFHQFLMQRAKMPFVWGANDCALFAADGIEAITGVDIAADFRGKYSDEAGAWAAVHTVTGGATIADAAAWCAAKHGFAEWTHPRMARRGDLVVFTGAGGVVASGLIHLSGAHIVAIGESGLYRFSITKVLRAWHYE